LNLFGASAVIDGCTGDRPMAEPALDRPGEPAHLCPSSSARTRSCTAKSRRSWSCATPGTARAGSMPSRALRPRPASMGVTGGMVGAVDPDNWGAIRGRWGRRKESPRMSQGAFGREPSCIGISRRIADARSGTNGASDQGACRFPSRHPRTLSRRRSSGLVDLVRPIAQDLRYSG
jgi:hypothetical protein